MKIVFLVLSFLSLVVFAQPNLKDSVQSMVLIGVNYKANAPAGDLADRWGFHSHIGIDGEYKFKNNLTIGLQAGFQFGNQLRDSTIFTDLYNNAGTITATSGVPANILFLMRGATGYASVGYVFNKLGNNPNSGLWVSGGVGYMMHKIRIESLFDVVPQLEGDYRKGYDKLTMGFSTRQFIGYLYQADYRLLKFYGGIEFIQGFTQNVRTYNFDTGGPEPGLRTDLSYGLKVGWIIPIKKRTKGQYFY